MKRIDAHRERGTQIAELAVVLPFLCLIVFLVVEGADFVRTHLVLNNAAREGARLVSLPENQACSNPDSSNYASCRTNVTTAVKTYVCGEQGGAWSANICNPPAGKQLLVDPQSINLSFAIGQSDNGSGAKMAVASVSVSYPYAFRFLPGFASTPPTINLQTTAAFRNFY